LNTHREKRVLVVGDACVDRFIYGSVPRICPEAPVPVFIPETTEENMGMALNVGANISSLGMACSCATNSPHSILKKRYVESSINQMILRVDEEQKLTPCTHEQITVEQWNSDCLVVSDYCKGFVSASFASDLSSRFPVSFLDTKKPISDWCEGFSFIKINEQEYNRSFSYIPPTVHEKIIVTLGKRGCMYRNKIYSPPKISNTVNVCGAGDTFMAGLVVEYCKSGNIERAIDFALLCSSDVVQRRGVAVPFGKDNKET
jgi:bifunctional ADP-heptose synthase (sugar kinase/adenylyltransferase)